MHTLLADRAQPYDKSFYSTFIAESASIGNEMLLNDYMVAHAANRSEKLYYLGQGLESIRTTYFRQVMFAEFELAIHEELEQGRPLSGARMSEMYCGLLRKYYGEAEGVMKIDPQYCIEWAVVPHPTTLRPSARDLDGWGGFVPLMRSSARAGQRFPDPARADGHTSCRRGRRYGDAGALSRTGGAYEKFLMKSRRCKHRCRR